MLPYRARPGRSPSPVGRSRTSGAQQSNDVIVPGDPYGCLSGIGPNQYPTYRSTGEQRSGGWGQSRHPEHSMHETADFTSSENGPRDGGHYSVMFPQFDYAHANIYPGEATTDPEWLEGQLGTLNYGEGGYGELIPGFSGGRGYGYREMDPGFALAQWKDRAEPYVPGRGGFVTVDEGPPKSSGNFGYRLRADYGDYPQPREFNDRERDNMLRQLPDGHPRGDFRSWYDTRSNGGRRREARGSRNDYRSGAGRRRDSPRYR